MNEAEEQAWVAGNRSAWREMLARCLTELGYECRPPGTTVELARVVSQLEQARAALRDICARHGDNNWTNDLNLRDVIDKHLARHLDERCARSGGEDDEHAPETCSQCGAVVLGHHACEVVPGGFSDDENVGPR